MMSLDVSLVFHTPIIKKGTGVFIREKGTTRELTVEEVMEKFPNTFIEENEYEDDSVYSANITHNLGRMADKANIYEALWRPYRLKKDYKSTENDDEEMRYEKSVTTKAKEIIKLLEIGLADLKARPEYFEQFDAPNGWGLYIHFVPFVENYLNACRKYPESTISVWR